MNGTPDTENWLEISFILLGAGMLGALAVLAAGGLSGPRRRMKIFREAPPAAGEVPSQKHQGILSVATM